MKRMATILGIMLVCASLTATVMALDPLDKKDAEKDNDRDGLSNYDEFVWSSDPNDPDSDGGGAYDGWEVWYEENPATEIADGYHFSPNDAEDEGVVANLVNLVQVRDGDANVNVNDPDNDGWNNLHEWLVGTDPTNPNTDGDHFASDSADPNPLVSDDDHEGGDGNDGDGDGGSEDHPDAPDGGSGNGGGGSGEGQAIAYMLAWNYF